MSFPLRRDKGSPLGPWQRVTSPGSFPSELAAGRAVEAKPPCGSPSPAGEGPFGPAALRGEERRGEAGHGRFQPACSPGGAAPRHRGSGGEAGENGGGCGAVGRSRAKSGPSRRDGRAPLLPEKKRPGKHFAPPQPSKWLDPGGFTRTWVPGAVSRRRFFSPALI